MSSSTDPAAYRLTLERFLSDAARFGGIRQLTHDMVYSLAGMSAPPDHPVLQLGEYADWSINTGEGESPGFIRLDLRDGDATPDELRAALEAELVPPDEIFAE